MTRYVALLALIIMACGATSTALSTIDPSTVSPPLETPSASTPITSPTPASTIAPPATFTPTPDPSPTPTLASDPRVAADDVQLFPWPLYAGDRLSVDVDPFLPEWPVGAGGEEARVTLTVGSGRAFTSTVAAMGLDGAPQARFHWVTDLSTVPQTTVFTVTLDLPAEIPDADPANNTTVFSVAVHPLEDLPPPEPFARWVVTETVGFRLHYLDNSAAERDLPAILTEARAAYSDVAARLGSTEERVDIYLLDRVVGQGGYASGEWVAVTYTDRRYSPVALSSVLRHELTHSLDGVVGCDGAPTLLREGFAVYMAGGHYRREPLRERGAALVATTHYLPLSELVEDFYTHQHEISYLEAGSLVQFIADRYGQDGITDACRAASVSEGNDHVRLEAAVGALGYEGIPAFERAWHVWLEGADVRSYDQVLLDLEFRLMDAMRAYQASYDPPAHFLEGILFSPAEAERQGIVADFVRRPREAEPVGLELVLAMAQEALEQRDPLMLEILVEDVEAALARRAGETDFVEEAVEITAAALEENWEPYRILLEFDERYLVYALDRQQWPQQSALTAEVRDGVWTLEEVQWDR
ncbi:MAG: hypothetical protein ACP5HS_06000 [Anaerolineae bacterium]